MKNPTLVVLSSDNRKYFWKRMQLSAIKLVKKI